MHRSILFGMALFGVACASAHADTVRPQWRATLDDLMAHERFNRLGTSFDSAAGVGAVLRRDVVRYSPDGAVVWSYDACPACAPTAIDAVTVASLLLPDGSAWLSVVRTDSPPAPSRQYVVRLAADGSVVGETEIPLETNAAIYRTTLVGDAAHVVALVPTRNVNSLRWSRVATGAAAQSRVLPLTGARDDVLINRIARWPDGGISVAVVQANSSGCMVDPPICPPPLTTLLRLEADGAERWRHELGEERPAPFVAFDADESGLVASTPQDAPLVLRRLAADGTLGAPATIPTIVGVLRGGIAGPVDGRYFVTQFDTVRLIDRDGATIASRPRNDFGYGNPLAHGEYGFIVAHDMYDAVLVPPGSLLTIATQFNVDAESLGSLPPGLAYWRMLADGTVYTVDPGGADEARIARFAVPGSPADDQIFRDGVDSI